MNNFYVDQTRDERGTALAPDPARPLVRAGGMALSVLATPLNLKILQALSDGPMRLAELRKATGLPAQTTLRGHLSNLAAIGTLTKRPTEETPYVVEHALTPMGEAMLAVAERLSIWLRQSPDGPIPLESGAAKGAIKALVDGWDSKMMGSLAAHPRSLTELDSLISDLSYPALERRLSSMRIAGLVEARRDRRVMGTPYGVTDWARRAIAPLAAACHCERSFMRDASAPVTPLDIEAAFLLAVPLIELPAQAEGTCQLEVDAGGAEVSVLAGIEVTVERGRVLTSASRPQAGSAAYVTGTALSWFNAVEGGRVERLRFGGRRRLGESIVSGLHSAFNHR